MWQANVFTIFPQTYPGNLGVSLIGKALEKKIWNLNLIDLKNFPAKNDRIDSSPYGGGNGMILSNLTFEKAFNSLSKDAQKMKKFYLSPRGRQLNQKDITSLSKTDGVTFLCGRYEGVDQRIIDIFDFEEISIGDFVLLGGDAGALVIIEAIVRLLPGVVGDQNSIKDESFQNFLLEYDQYTHPKIFHNLKVPEVLLSGDHKKIEDYRFNLSKFITRKRRPDLWAKYISYVMKKNN